MTDDQLTIRCVCGREITGAEDEVVSATGDHGRRLHNMDATRDEILAMAVRGSETATDLEATR
jgi:hypothetical protein